MALYIPHSIFPFGAAFVCQAGKFGPYYVDGRIILQFIFSKRCVIAWNDSKRKCTKRISKMYAAKSSYSL